MWFDYPVLHKSLENSVRIYNSKLSCLTEKVHLCPSIKAWKLYYECWDSVRSEMMLRHWVACIVFFRRLSIPHSSDRPCFQPAAPARTLCKFLVSSVEYFPLHYWDNSREKIKPLKLSCLSAVGPQIVNADASAFETRTTACSCQTRNRHFISIRQVSSDAATLLRRRWPIFAKIIHPRPMRALLYTQPLLLLLLH